MNKRIAIYVGSFNPFHEGHKNIVSRALMIFDKVIIGVGVNPEKTYTVSAEERVGVIKAIFPGLTVEAYTGLTIDFAKRHGAGFIVRGVRDTTDFEYETECFDYNRDNGGLETIWLPAIPELRNVSSTKIRQK